MNGYGLSNPAAAPTPSDLLAGASPIVGGSTPLPTTAVPRRPSVPTASSSFGAPSHAASTSAHHQSLLQHARGSFSGGGSNPLLPTDGGPPHKVPVHRAFVRVREMEPGEEFPSISPADQARVKGWIERDVAYEEELVGAKQARAAEANAMLEEMAKEQDWLGPLQPQPQGKFRLRFPDVKVKEEARGKRGELRQPVPLSKAQLRATASTPEHLIPIRLDLEHEVYKLRDTFTWNLEETTITPQLFAEHLLADLRLPRDPFLKQMVVSIQKQLEEAKVSAAYEGYVDASVGEAAEESRGWWEERARKRRRLGKERAVEGEEATEAEEGPLPVAGEREDGLRVLIKLDITLDTIQLVDKFEWELSNPRNSPEEFAETFAAELGLTGEFATAIAHSIREQVELYTRSLYLLHYSKGGVVSDDDLRREFLPSLQDPFRTDLAESFTPLLHQLTRDEVDRLEKEHDRENRRKRRQTKGRGVTLPDREPARTNRTLVPRSLPGLVSFEVDIKQHKTYHLPELNEPYPIVGRPVPPKPAYLDTNDASPLKLQLKSSAAAGSLVGVAAANRWKKGAQAEGGGPGESPVKAAPGRKKPPVIRPNPEELGLHEHIVDGQWFCANCGVPERVAVGRRKGPTGKDSLCGLCGKYFHRYKRQRPCTYTRDLDTHLRLRAEEDAKSKGKKRGAEGAASEDVNTRPARSNARSAPASRAMSPGSSIHDGGDDSDASSSGSPRKRRTGYYGSPDTPFVQLDSDDSDEEESVAEGSPPPTQQSPPQPAAPLPVPPPPAQPSGPQPLPWMLAAAAELRARQVDDRFEIIPRPRPADPAVQEWRIRCLDCPGKLYNLGPGETLDGFLVHFKNRVHRTNVDTRLARERGQ
ncbi:SWI/SNF chromatin-remodeling complex subunit [Rhodosporidiobolus nylandii]